MTASLNDAFKIMIQNIVSEDVRICTQYLEKKT